MRLPSTLRLGFALAFASGCAVAACGSDSRASFGGNPGDTASSSGGGGTFDPRDASAPDAAQLPVVGWLTGKVVAPEGTVPVSDAMVYLTTREPAPIPSAAYCDTCVQLAANEPYAYSKADGTFELAAYQTGKQLLVVQKGQFRRVREVTVLAGDQVVPSPYTRLPGKTDAAAKDTIPRIAMVVGGYDKIDVSMKKLGIEEFYRYGDAPFALPGDSNAGTKTGKTGKQLTTSAPEMGNHHIVLLPCASFGYTQDQNNGGFVCGGPTDGEKTALRSYVEGGGKLYVTDFAYEGVRQTWPGFVTFYDATNQPMTDPSKNLGRGCRGGAEDTPGTANDPGLAKWMTAIGEADIELQKSWSRIASVQSQPGVDAKGNPKTITPKVWMSSTIAGTERPATVSFEQKCGRVLFSTYHTEGDNNSKLLAQEKALLYILLEVGVCVGALPPPPPPR